MARRSYDQYCPLAVGLDVIGDRWAPLVIRELLLGPCRYRDLARGLPGVATDILTRRLRDLERAGVVARRELPPPAGATVYELTDRGERLRGPLLAMARWGLELLPPPHEGLEFTPGMLANALHALLDPEPGERLTVALEAGGEAYAIEVADGVPRVRRGAPEVFDLRLRGEPGALVEALLGGAAADGVEIAGDERALQRLRAMVALPEHLRSAVAAA